MSTFQTPNIQQLTAAMRCRSAEMKPLVDMFEQALEQTTKTLVTAIEPVNIHRLQGRAHVLKDFLDLVNTADQSLARQSDRRI